MTLTAGRRAATSRSEETGRGQGLRMAAALLVAGLVLAGCQVSEFATGAPQYAPIPVALERKMERLGMKEESPILLRIFKEESVLEVWKKDRTGRYALLTEYEICAWSGELGPKKKEGDRQAPEGFYHVTPGLMNPKSSYHLAFNIGFPNSFDRSLGRTGTHIMVHGDCSSRGCFAMDDNNIEEIYALAREAFEGGQRYFQLQSFPFRMTPENIARHAGNEHMAFWEMLKEGYDHFEVTKLEPDVDVCKGRYVFNAKPIVGSFSANAACPAFEVDPAVEQLVAAKRDADKAKTETLVADLERKKEREERWAEREQTIAAFFNTSRAGAPEAAAAAVASGDAREVAAAPAASAPSATATVAPAAPVVIGGVPLPRPAPRAVAAASEPSGGGFRLWGRRAPASEPVASTAAATAAPTGSAPAAAPAGVASTAAPALAASSSAPAAEAAPAPVAPVAASPEPLPTTTALGYQPEETEDGFLASVAKGSRGLFRKAGDLFN